MKPGAIWSFIAGDSRTAPLAVGIAVATAVALVHVSPGAGAWIGVVFVTLIAAGLVAAVFERT